MDSPSSLQPEKSLEPSTTMSLRRYGVLLGLITLGALVLRIWHVAWGLPSVFEEAYPFMKGWGFWNWGAAGVDLNPHFFNYPALTFYLHWGAQALHYAVGYLFGLYQSLEAFRAAYESDPTRAIVIARSLNSLFDVGTVLAVAVLARRLVGSIPSLLVAGLSAVNPLQIQMSQQVNVDVPMTFFLVIALWWIVRIYEAGTTRAYIWAGVTIGLAAACKYTAAVLLIPLLVAHVLRVFGTRSLVRTVLDVQLFVSVMVSEVLFLLLNPYILLDAATFKRGFGFELEHMAAGHFGIAEQSSSVWYYLAETVPGALGWVLAAAALGGVVILFRQKDRIRRWIPILTYLVIFFALIFLWKMRADRYFLPLLPGILLITAVTVESTVSFLRRQVQNRFAGGRGRVAAGIAVVLCTTVLGAESVNSVAKYHTLAGKNDTRTVAREWISSHMGSDIVVVMAPLGLSVAPPRTVLLLPYVSVNFHLLDVFYDARWYVDCDLVVGSDFDRARYFVEPQKFGRFLQYFYDSLNVRWRTLATIEPGDERRGPCIWLYAPPGPATSDLFPQGLLERLDEFPNTVILVRFGLGLANILAHKGKSAKADQLWNYVSARALADRDPVGLFLALSTLPEEIRAIPQMQHLMQQLALKATQGRGAL